MHKSSAFCLVMLITIGLLASTASAVSINGSKFFDSNQNGTMDDGDFPLQNWNITLFYSNGTAVPGKVDTTGIDGTYNISGIDPDFNYTICEGLKPGWTNTTPSCYPITFKLCGDGGLEFLTNKDGMDNFMDNVPDHDSQALLLYNARIGNALTGTGKEEELKIAYPLGQWNPGQSSSGLSPDGEFSWTNNTYVPFNATWVPGVTLYQDASWDVDGITIVQNDTHARPDAVPIRDIVIRLHSENEDYKVEINNLSIHQGAVVYNLVNSHFLWSGSTKSFGQDLFFVFRASDALIAHGGQNIGSGGFSFTGDMRFIWPEADSPKQNNIKMDIIVGIYNCTAIDFLTRDFGNFIGGSVSGYKIDNETKHGIANWPINLTNTSGLVNSTMTDGTGFYRFQNLAFGTYNVSEELLPCSVPVGPTIRKVIINVTNPTITGVNFTNTQSKFCIEGYKRDEAGAGLEDWTVTVRDAQNQEVGNSTTDMNGFYRICNLTPGDYTVCEELQPGFVNLTPLCKDVTLGCTNLSGVNFTNTPAKVSIGGYKLDEYGNGLDGWKIRLYNETFGTLVQATTTGAGGHYQFTALKPGFYNITEEQQAGWLLTNPPTGWYSHIFVNGIPLTMQFNFTNHRDWCWAVTEKDIMPG